MFSSVYHVKRHIMSVFLEIILTSKFVMGFSNPNAKFSVLFLLSFQAELNKGDSVILLFT